jgi:hypothetical protein
MRFRACIQHYSAGGSEENLCSDTVLGAVRRTFVVTVLGVSEENLCSDRVLGVSEENLCSDRVLGAVRRTFVATQCWGQ